MLLWIKQEGTLCLWDKQSRPSKQIIAFELAVIVGLGPSLGCVFGRKLFGVYFCVLPGYELTWALPHANAPDCFALGENPRQVLGVSNVRREERKREMVPLVSPRLQILSSPLL